MKEIRTPFLSFLVEKGMVQKEDFGKGIAPESAIGDLSFEEQVINSGLVSAEQFRSLAEEFFGTSFASPSDFPREPILLDHLSTQFMKESKFIPSRLTDNTLTVVMSNPLRLLYNRGHAGWRPILRFMCSRDGRMMSWRPSSDLTGWVDGRWRRSSRTRRPYLNIRAEDEENVDHLRDMGL